MPVQRLSSNINLSTQTLTVVAIGCFGVYGPQILGRNPDKSMHILKILRFQDAKAPAPVLDDTVLRKVFSRRGKRKTYPEKMRGFFLSVHAHAQAESSDGFDPGPTGDACIKVFIHPKIGVRHIRPEADDDAPVEFARSGQQQGLAHSTTIR